MMAGIIASRHGQVSLFEKNEKLGKKLYITGKGRCNLTNNKDISEFFPAVVRNPEFLYSAFYQFTNQDLQNLIPLDFKVERETGSSPNPISPPMSSGPWKKSSGRPGSKSIKIPRSWTWRKRVNLF